MRSFQWGIFSTPACLEYLRDEGVVFANSWFDSDFLVSTDVRRLLVLRRLLPWKQFVVYADDPRLDRSPSGYRGDALCPDVTALNVFSGHVFEDNFAFCNMHGIGEAPHPAHVSASHFETRRKVLASMMAFSPAMQGDPAPPTGCNLHRLRVEIMHEAYRQQFGAVMGAGWPESYGASDSGHHAVATGHALQPWSTSKLHWLGGFWFNLCFENTLAPYYVTEKIWHSILAGCVPVYFGGNSTICEDFPVGSFVDFSNFKSPSDLIEYLSSMSAEEAAGIYSRAVDAYLRMLDRRAPSLEVVELRRARRFVDALRGLRRLRA